MTQPEQLTARQADQMQAIQLLPQARPGDDAILRRHALEVIAGQIGYPEIQRLRREDAKRDS